MRREQLLGMDSDKLNRGALALLQSAEMEVPMWCWLVPSCWKLRR